MRKLQLRVAIFIAISFIGVISLTILSYVRGVHASEKESYMYRSHDHINDDNKKGNIKKAKVDNNGSYITHVGQGINVEIGKASSTSLLKHQWKPITSQTSVYKLHQLVTLGFSKVRNITWTKMQLSTLNQTSPKKLEIQAMSGSRMGNVLSVIASLYGLALRTNRTALYSTIASQGVSRDVVKTFPNINTTIKVIHGKLSASIRIPASTSIFPNEDVNIRDLHKHYTWPWEPYRSAIRHLFTFKDALQRKSKEILLQISKQYQIAATDFTFVGIHIRRGDKAATLKLQKEYRLPGSKWFVKAMDYYKHKYGEKKCIFVVGSDNIRWGKTNLNFSRVHFLTGQSGAQDMCTLIKCNHTIISEGTFSRWVGILTKGEVVTLWSKGTYMTSNWTIIPDDTWN